MNELKKEFTKFAVATPVGLCAGKVAMDVVERILPRRVRIPVKIVRYVGTAAVGLVAEATVSRAVDDLVETASAASETIKETRKIQKRLEKNPKKEGAH